MYEYRAQVVEIVDGDTVKLDVDLGFSIRQRMTLRLYGINAPEMVGATRAKGEAARDYLAKLIPADSFVTIRTHKDKSDKYGRILAEIYAPGALTHDTVYSVNQAMIDAGHAVPYYVGK